MAGIPKTVLNRSDELLKELEKGREQMSARELGKVKVSPIQLSMFQLDDPVLIGIKDQLQYLDLNSISPIEALLKLNELKKLFGS
jgi:DNA mismatch repair protein MutS